MQAELERYAADGGTDYEPSEDKPSYWDKYYEHIDWVDAMEIAEPILEEMDEEFDEGRGWASESDINRVWTCIQEGPEAFVEEYNEQWADNDRFSSRTTLTFPNYRIAVLWAAEITGQISDGAWENSLHEPEWKELVGARIEVDESLDEAEGEGHYQNLAYVRKLREHEGHEERMIFYVRAAGHKDHGYDHSDLLSDLQALKGINN